MLFKALFFPLAYNSVYRVFPVRALFQTSVGLLIAFFPPLISFLLYCEIISLILFFKGQTRVTVFSSHCSWNITGLVAVVCTHLHRKLLTTFCIYTGLWPSYDFRELSGNSRTCNFVVLSSSVSDAEKRMRSCPPAHTNGAVSVLRSSVLSPYREQGNGAW